MSEQVCISTTHEMKQKLASLSLSPSEVFRAGCGVLIAEKEQIEPETGLQKDHKIAALVARLTEAHKRIAELEEQLKPGQIEEPSSVESAPLKEL